MSDERVNIFQNLDRDSFKLIRQGIIDLVLATDMSKHFVHLNKFVSVFTNSIVSVCRYFTNYLNLFKLVLNCSKLSEIGLKLVQICQGIINLVLATDMSKAFRTPQKIRQRLHQLNCFGMQLFLNYSNLFEIVQINLNLSKLDYYSEIVSVYNYFQIRKNRIFIFLYGSLGNIHFEK